MTTVKVPSGATVPADPPQTRPAPGSARTAWFDALVLAAAALAMRVAQLDHNPFVDELNHVLAARSLLEDGTLYIGAGGEAYERARLFTYAVAGVFRLLGESLVAARIPSVIAGVALIVGVYLWTRSVSSRLAGLIAATLLMVDPQSYYLSQLARFYTLHALLFFLAAISLHGLFAAASSGRTGRVLALVAAALASLALALHFQATTLIGAMGLILWLAYETREPVARWLTLRTRLLILVALAAIGIAFLLSPEGRGAVAAFTRANHVWAQETRYTLHYYFILLAERHPTVWTLFPLLLPIALLRYGRPARLCAFVFVTAIVLHSLAAQKTERYLHYAIPMLFIIVGMGVSVAVNWMHEYAVGWLRSRYALGLPSARRLAGVGVAGLVAFAAAGNAGFVYTYRMVTTDDASWRIQHVPLRGEPSWGRAAAALRPLVDSSSVVMASTGLKATYYLGRVDVVLNRDDVRNETLEREEFAPNTKVGVPVIGELDSVEAVFRCHESGLVLVEDAHWRQDGYVPPAVADFLSANAREIDLPRDWRLRVFHWSRQDPESGDGLQDCGRFSSGRVM